MTRIKVCGITNLSDALKAVELGADALGFIFADSTREIAPDDVRKIVEQLPPYIARVGVFVGESAEIIESVAKRARLTEVQLYVDPQLAKLSLNGLDINCQLSFRVKDESVLEQIESLGLKQFHLDAYHPSKVGGTGQTFDWAIAAKAARLGQLTLSGGLNPDNVFDALEAVRPYAVDVSSGIETDSGTKDQDKLRKFIQEVRRWDAQTN